MIGTLVALAPGKSQLGDLNGSGACMFWMSNQIHYFAASILRANGKMLDVVEVPVSGKIYFKTSENKAERKITYYLNKQSSGGFATLSILTFKSDPQTFRVALKRNDGKKAISCHFN